MILLLSVFLLLTPIQYHNRILDNVKESLVRIDVFIYGEFQLMLPIRRQDGAFYGQAEFNNIIMSS